VTLLLNILWFILGGWISALAWFLAGLIMAVTIIGLPWAPAAFRMAMFSLAPFGKQVVASGGPAEGPVGCLLNALWFLLAGWWLALHHIVLGVGLMLTLIGIPFGIQHIKLAALSLAPVGKTVVER
jgi:uncharacterized membrane protein YccF (DUF307 family)